MRPADSPVAGHEARGDDRFAQLLADAHQSVVFGGGLNSDTGREALREDTPRDLADRLAGAGACLRLIERIRRTAPEARAEVFAAIASPGREAAQFSRDGESFNASSDDTVHDGWPRSIGRFEIVRPLGQGGFGVVFLAHDPRLRRHVALKVPRPENVLTGELKRRFLREAEAAAGLSHAGIVPVFESGQDGAVCYIASGLCEGPTLKEWLASRNEDDAVGAGEAAALVLQVAEAVQHAHDRAVLHRDLKPANILLESQPDGRRTPRITDFGLAKLLDSEVDETRSGAVLGTPAYMAPEQADPRGADVGPSTDIYAVGVVLYELLTGVSPFARSTAFLTMRAVREDEPRRPRKYRPSISRDLEAICLQCLDKNPARRYPSATALADDLQRYLRNEPVQARRAGNLERLVRWTRRNPLLAGLSLLAAVLLVSVSVVSTLAAVRIEEQRQELEYSLGRTADAERESARSERTARRRLYESLVAQADAEQATGRTGQRTRSLAALDEAARLARDLGADAEELRQLRTKAVAALALADLEPDRRWDVTDSIAMYSGAAFDPDLEHYAVAERNPVAATIHRLVDNELLQRLVIDRASDWRPTLEYGAAGRHLAAQFGQDRDARVSVWELATGRTVLSLDVEYGRPANHLMFAFSHDERLFAAAHADQSVGVFDLETGERVLAIPPDRWTVSTLAISPDNKTLAVSRGPAVRLFGIPGGAATEVISAQPQTMSWDSSGDLLAMAGTGGTVEIWRVGSGDPQLVLTEPDGRVEHVALRLEGAILAASSMSGSARLWDTLTGRELVATEGRVARFSRDGRWLGLLGRGPEIERRRVHTGREHLLLAGASRMQALVYVDPAGEWLITHNSQGTDFWDLNLGQLAASLPRDSGMFYAVEAHPSGLVAWRRTFDGELFRQSLVLHSESGARVLEVQPGSRVEVTAEGPDASGRILALNDGMSAAILEGTNETPLLFRTTAEGKYLPLPALRNLDSAALSTNRNLLAAASFLEKVTVTDLVSRRVVWRHPARPAHAAVGFSPDGKLLAVGTSQDLTFFDVGSWQPRARFERPMDVQQRIMNVAWSADASLVACQADEHVIRLLDGSLLSELVRFEIERGDSLFSLAFSADGSRLVAGSRNGRLHVWNLWQIRHGLRRIGLDWSDGVLPPLPTSPTEKEPLVVRFLVRPLSDDTPLNRAGRTAADPDQVPAPRSGSSPTAGR